MADVTIRQQEYRMRQADRPFVVVSGLPGSGKTTVARVLGSLLMLPVLDKDEILARLFETRGVGDDAWRRQLSRESDALFQAAVSSSSGAIVTSFWHVEGMAPDSGTPTAWLGALSRTIVNVRCECPPPIAAARFVQRARHAGHLDGRRTAADVLASIQSLPAAGHLDIGETVVVDTTRPVQPAQLLRDVDAAFARC
jgi:AAA domain